MESFNKILENHCLEKNNRLCIGLDIDNRKLENTSLDYMKSFTKDIIDNTIDLCPVYKINLAFYERLGYEGIKILSDICNHIGSKAIKIGDAKRGDIGNSSKYYAEAIFEKFCFDSITVSPYMGRDSVEPFLEYKDKGTFILCLTSNKGSEDLQGKILTNNKSVYSHIAEFANNLNYNDNVGLVVGATKTDDMKDLKLISGSLPWLIPGVGFQGGNLEESLSIGSINNSIPLINVSRGIIYAGNGSIQEIREAAEKYTNEIRDLL